jgi:hypothetical protein
MGYGLSEVSGEASEDLPLSKHRITTSANYRGRPLIAYSIPGIAAYCCHFHYHAQEPEFHNGKKDAIVLGWLC